jgi:hypothetical protein
MNRTTTITVANGSGLRRILDRPHCWCCPPIIADYQRRGWPQFTRTRFRPKLHHGRRVQWVVWDLHRGVISRQLGGHQALAIYWADRFNQDVQPRAVAALTSSPAV